MSHPEIERFTPALTGRIAYEHLHRYALARDYSAGLEALDLGCGEGYGTSIIGGVAAHVTGLDIDAETVSAARAKYGVEGRVAFREGDSRATPFEASSFDVVVALETIEHIAEPERLVLEARRILRPGGLFIVSTPNREIYNRYKEPNPFHLKEMSAGEFVEMLGGSFAHVELVGQRLAIVSTLAPTAPTVDPSNWPGYRGYTGGTGRKAISAVETGAVSLDEPEYLIALCSDEPIQRKVEPHSIFLSASDDLWAEHEKIFAWASGLHNEDEALRQRVAELSASLEAETRLHRERAASLAQAESESTHLRALIETYARQADSQAEAFAALSEAYRSAQQREIGPPAADQGGMHILGRMLARLSGQPATEDLGSLVDALAGVIDERAGSRVRMEAAHHELASAVAARADAEHRAAAAEDKLARVESELAAAVSDHTGAAKSNEELRLAISAASAEIEYLVAQRDQDAGQIAALHREYQSLVADNSELSRKLDDLESQDALRTNVIQAAVAARDALAAELAATTRSMRAEIQRLTSQSQSRSRELESVKAEAERHAQDVLRLSQEVSAARSAVPAPANESRHHAIALRLKALEEEAADLRAAQATGEQMVTASNAKLREASDKAERLRAIAGRSLREASLAAREVNALEERAARNLHEKELAQAALAESLGDLLPFATSGAIGKVSVSRRARFKKLLGRSIAGEELSEFVRMGDAANARRDWAVAEAAYAEALKRDPALVAIWVQYGHALKEQGRPALAEVAYRRAIHLAPNDADAHLQLGHLLKMLGRTPAASTEYAKALEIDPDFQLARRELEHLRPPEPVTPMRALERLAGELEALDRPADAPSAVPGSAIAAVHAWPPPSINEYWLPQRLRDYLVETVGEEPIALYQYLFSVIERYGDDPQGFEASAEISLLAARARLLAGEHRSSTPSASILVPAYNNLLLTLTSIVSVLECAGSKSFEILVGDDRSTDATAQVIGAIGGAVRLITHPQNLGFLRNCNETANFAVGDTIVLLNNDTLVLPGWLDKLIETFDVHADAGYVGSKLLNGDGTLQEAGGIFWRDGSAWNFGRNQNASLPEFNFVRRTDYCSGASIALPMALWRRLGGFDEHFLPAYCEDADLAFRVRAVGLEVYYQPQSQLVHHEGRSHGRDLNSGIKAYQVTNQKKLVERWRPELERDHYENGTHVFRARDRSRSRPHIVVVDHYVPQWDRDAGSRTLYQYMRMLKDAGFEVAFWPDNLNFDREYAPTLQALGIEVIYSPAYHDRFNDWLSERASDLDYVLLSRPHVAAKYIDSIRAHRNIRILYYGHDLHFSRMQRASALAPGPGDAAAIAETKALEVGICAKCDVVYYPGEAEAATMRALVGPETVVQAFPILMYEESEIARAEAVLPRRAESTSCDLLFVGGFSHSPNTDGISWFVQEVMPLLRQSGRPFRLHIVGSNAPAQVRSLAANDIEVHGRVSDERLAALYALAGLAVVPLRYGAGVKGKVIEAMAFGVPVAMTDVGAQGIPGAERLAFVASTPQAMADAIVAAVDNPADASARAGAALGFIRRDYSVAAVRHLIAQHVPELLGQSSSTGLQK